MFKLWKQIVKEININKMIWAHTIGGGLLDEPGKPGKPGRRDCCLLLSLYIEVLNQTNEHL